MDLGVDPELTVEHQGLLDFVRMKPMKMRKVPEGWKAARSERKSRAAIGGGRRQYWTHK